MDKLLDEIETNSKINSSGINGIINNTTGNVKEALILDEKFKDFLKIQETYKLKKVARNCSNFYHDSKENIDYERKETTAEHIYSSLKLADYFIFEEEEFVGLDRLKVYDLLKYHDDVEIITEDTCISDTENRIKKQISELDAIPIIVSKYPKKLGKRLLLLDAEYRENNTPEAKFAHAIDKMDALVHELEYHKDRGPKGFSKANVIKWFQPAFEYSPTFMRYFSTIIKYLEDNNYF